MMRSKARWTKAPKAKGKPEMGRRGKKKGRPLLIAETHSEEKLTQRYALYSGGFFVIASGALIWGINNLLDYLK